MLVNFKQATGGMEKQWHQYTTAAALELVKSSAAGLSEREAASRLQQYGPNQLVEKKRRSRGEIFLAQFKELMILILLAAAVISGLVGDVKDTVVICIIVIIN